MATGESTIAMSEGEVYAFARKAQAWADTLDAKQQAVLAELVRRAVGEPSSAGDTTGFAAVLTDGVFGWGIAIVAGVVAENGDTLTARRDAGERP